MSREVKNNPRMRIPIFGNGDIDTPQKALEYKNKYGVDGIMIGRAAIGAPWIFRQLKKYIFDGVLIEEPGIEEKVNIIKQHLQHSISWKGEVLGVLEMRQHYANYLKGLPNVKHFRSLLCTEKDPAVLLAVLDEIREAYSPVEV